MTISNTKAKSVYETNGERREWEIGFDFDSNVSKLNIILEDREGYQTIVEDNYLIEDGVVIYPSLESELDPIAEGYKIVLIRETANNQEIDYRDNLVEQGLDKLTLQVQEIAEEVDRAIKVPVSEEGLSNYKNPVLEIREETKKSLHEIEEATSVVSDYAQASALNAVTSKEEADRAVEASNVSVMASSDAEAFSIKAENLANEATNAVSAYVNGLGAMRNSVLDLGVFEDNQRRASSSIIDFDFEPLDVFIRFSDSEKKMWINGSHSFAGIEKVGYRKYKIFYSVSPEDFSAQSAIKGPFYVQYVIKYSVFSGKPVTYRGRVDTVDQLPETAEDGDLWYVGPVEQSNKEEYIWQNGKWELLGSTDFTNIYTKEEIDNKITVIEADIDANADAILKTRGDFMESDSELQQQINAHAEELTTQRNDIDGLGDQVAGIEGKIPETATDANPLVTKQELLDAEMDIRDDVDTKDGELQEQLNAQATAIAGKQDTLTAGEGISIDGNVISATGGGGEVPDNVYTQDNLIAGKNVSFTEVPPEGGIDEHTLACWHFDENNIDEVNNVSIEVDGLQYSDTSGTFKFGKSLTFNSSGAKSQDISSEFSLTNNWTIDCWIYFDSWSGKEVYLLNKNDNTYYKNYGLCIQNSGTIQLKDTIFTTDVSLTNSLHHYAVSVERKEDSNESYAYLFIDGVLQNKVVLNNWSGFSISCLYLKTSGNKDSVNIDELRISDCVRWTEDFTPPTEPYTLATGPSKTAVNAIVAVPTKTSELENDSGFLTGLPDNVYTAENLVAGDNITFTPKNATVNADIVGSPVISDNYEVSGFSDNDYLEIDDPIVSASEYGSFEIGFAFNANTLDTSNAGIYDGGEGGSGGYRITIHYQNVRARIITSSSGTYGVDLIGSTTLETGKKYYAKVNYSSETGYTLSLKEEGGEWVVDASTSTTKTPYPAISRKISIGDNKGGAGFTFDGTIYLPEMHIDIDGKRAWTGVLPDRTVVSADNVYKKTNLLGGKDIEIVPEPVEGGIDEYTLGVFHFENTSTYGRENAVEGGDSLASAGGSQNTDYFKFGSRCLYVGGYYNQYQKTGLTEEGDWTIDHWARFLSSASFCQASLGLGYSGTSYSWFVKFQTDTQMAYVLTNSGTQVASAPITLPINEWVHLAAEKHGNTINGYLNGVKVISYTDSSVKNTSTYRYLTIYPYAYIDELRFSKIARYKGDDFTPPTKAYSVAEPTGNMVVNYTGKAGGAFDFQGTEEEFDAAVEAGKITDDTVSLVTDDNSGELVATKAELAAVDASKADTALSNVLSNIDYVIESKFPTADDPTWYRVYKSGWVEQGGRFTGTSITFLLPFADTNYSFHGTSINTNAGGAANTVTDITTNSITYYTMGNAGGIWYACGQGA